MLAVAAHINAAFVPLVFVPLYAVERMARLSAERDRMARKDPLTDLANRTGLQAAFDDLRGDGPDDLPVAMLLLDLNRFKYVNDALGHEVGDRLLVAVAERLRDAVPPGATVARLGGDEFAVVAAVPGGAAEAEGLAGDICGDGQAGHARRPPDRHHRLDRHRGHTDHGDDFATVMRHADVAMYQAKQRGHAVAMYARRTTTTPRAARAAHRLPRRAGRRGRPDHLHYQPQVDLATDRVVGVEALLRWRHPTLGAVPPRELLRVAERSR